MSLDDGEEEKKEEKSGGGAWSMGLDDSGDTTEVININVDAPIQVIKEDDFEEDESFVSNPSVGTGRPQTAPVKHSNVRGALGQ